MRKGDKTTASGKGDAQKIAFLDRDGTINVDFGFVHKTEQLVLIPGSVEGVRTLQEAGFEIVIVTNQSGINRGHYTSADTERFHRHLEGMLRAAGVTIQKIYYCPHRPEEGCECRKPRTGFIEDYLRGRTVDRDACVVIGDKPSDIALGKNGGMRTALVLTGTSGPEAQERLDPTFVARDLLEAAQMIIAHDNRRTAEGEKGAWRP